MKHPNEPTLAELKCMRVELYQAASTPENLKRIKAIEVQIKRNEAEEAAIAEG